mgnify:CR=1 FL=1
MEEHVPSVVVGRSLQQNQFKRVCARLVGLWGRNRHGTAGQRRVLRRPLRNERGQALIEYMLVILIALVFTHQVFFNKNWGFKGVLEKTMLRLGSFLEQNLKSGTKVGGADGKLSLDPYAGTDRWSN